MIEETRSIAKTAKHTLINEIQNRRARRITQLVKLSINHSIGRTHIWCIFSIFLVEGCTRFLTQLYGGERGSWRFSPNEAHSLPGAGRQSPSMQSSRVRAHLVCPQSSPQIWPVAVLNKSEGGIRRNVSSCHGVVKQAFLSLLTQCVCHVFHMKELFRQFTKQIGAHKDTQHTSPGSVLIYLSHTRTTDGDAQVVPWLKST